MISSRDLIFLDQISKSRIQYSIRYFMIYIKDIRVIYIIDRRNLISFRAPKLL